MGVVEKAFIFRDNLLQRLFKCQVLLAKNVLRYKHWPLADIWSHPNRLNHSRNETENKLKYMFVLLRAGERLRTYSS